MARCSNGQKIGQLDLVTFGGAGQIGICLSPVVSTSNGGRHVGGGCYAGEWLLAIHMAILQPESYR